MVLDNQDKWAVIVNPKSGKRTFKRQLRYLFTRLNDKNVRYEARTTKYQGHAVALATLFAEKGYTKFLVLGGDGTLNEVVNGIFSSKVDNVSDFQLAIIPRGTGNDWGRFWGLDKEYSHSVEVFLKGNTKPIDTGKISFNVEGEKKEHFFINTIGIGLDATVVELTHRLKPIFGSHRFLYTLSLFLSVFVYRPYKLRLTSEQLQLNQRVFTMSVANGCYTGGGLKQTPDAVPYDGLFDVMIAEPPGFFDICSAMGKLFRGKLLEHRIIKSFRTKRIVIDYDDVALIEADGLIVNGNSPYDVTVLPDAIQMIVP